MIEGIRKYLSLAIWSRPQMLSYFGQNTKKRWISERGTSEPLQRENLQRDLRRKQPSSQKNCCYSNFTDALIETRFDNEGSVPEPKGAYTLFWKVKSEEEERIHGIEQAINSSILKQLPCRSDEAPFPTKCFPAYQGLQCINHNQLLGDFNARLGTDYTSWKGMQETRGYRQSEIQLPAALESLCREHFENHQHPLEADWKLQIILGPNSRHFLTMLSGKDILLVTSQQVAWEEQNAGPTTILSGQASGSMSPRPIRTNSHSPDYHSTSPNSMSLRLLCEQPGWKAYHQKTTHWKFDSTVGSFQPLDEKQKAFIVWQNDISSTSKRVYFKYSIAVHKTHVHRMQDEWWKTADEVHSYVGTKNSTMFFKPS